MAVRSLMAHKEGQAPSCVVIPSTKDPSCQICCECAAESRLIPVSRRGA